MMHFENDDDDISALFAPFAGNLPSPGLAPSYAASPSPTRSLFNHGGLTCNPVTEMGTAENAPAAAALTGSEMSEKAETTTIVVHHLLQRDSDNTECDSRFDMTRGMAISPQFAGFSGDQPLLLTPESHSLGGSFDLSRLRDAGEYSEIHELQDVKRVVQVMVSWNDSEFSSRNEFWLNIAVQALEKGFLVAHRDVHLFWKCKYTAFNFIEFEVGSRKTWTELNLVTRPPSGQRGGVFNANAGVEFLEKDFVEIIMEHIVLAFIRKLDRVIADLEIMVNIDWAYADFPKLPNLSMLFKKSVKSRSVCIFKAPPEAECKMVQLDSPCKAHIPKSSATNNVDVVELNNSIDDAKGGNTSSHKTHTISRWEKDYGITRQALEQLFGESRDAAAKTLKVSTSTLKRACRDFGIERWPNHRGKRPNNCSLNQKQDVQAVKKHKGIQPCPALPPLQATNAGECKNTMSVKVEKREEINQATFEPKKHHHMSSTVLGKKDHLDSVRGVGSYSTIQGMFGRPDQKQSTSSRVFTIDVVKEMMDKCRLDTITEMETKMQPKIDSLNQQLQLLMKNKSTTQISVGTPRSVYTPFGPPPTRSNYHSVDTYPVTTIKSPKKCTLAVCPGGTPTVVAKGMAHPSTDETVVYHQPSSTIGNFAQPPMHLVILDENLSKENKKTKDQSGDISATGTRPPIVDDDALQHLGVNCKYLVSLLTSFPLDKDYIDLEIDKSIFHHENMSFIFVMMDDIKDLLTMKCLNVSIIQVFILFLNRLCDEFQVMPIGFACPTQISKDMLKRNVPFVTNYFIHIMKENKDTQFILAPYHQDFHWLLLVISLRKRNIYVLDPLPCNRDIAKVKASMNLAFRFVPTNGQSKTINWIQCKCPIQPGRVECGYYVMRYMLDIVTKYSHVDRLDEAFESNNPYSMNDINEIRELWAKYFLEECV